MNYQDYKTARNVAWQILDDLQINNLPIKISDICRQLGVPVRSYGDAAAIIKKYQLEPNVQFDGFTAMVDGQPFIFFDETKPPARLRFTLAHELGHILLGHLPEGKAGIVVSGPNREPAPDDNPIEQAANVFASRLLAPSCVLWGLNVRTAAQIETLCNISPAAAEFRFERLQLLYQRDADFQRTKGHGCFLISPLEKQVYNNFNDYIKLNIL